MVARLMLSLDQHQYPILTAVFFVLIILVSTSYGDDSDDKDYTDCNKPFNCGLLPQLSYPFWGGDRPEVCGHEGFKLKCADGQLPILAGDALEFRLSSLNQSSRWMTLRLEKSQQYICPTQIPANSSSGRDNPIFGYDLSLQNLNLLYNCAVSNSEVLPESRISFCNGYNGTSFYGNDDILGKSSGMLDVDQCSMRIRIPIAKSFDQLVGDRQDLEKVLGDEFNVSYKYDQGPSICEGCMASKGICGSNMTHPDKEFMCLCRDQPYALVCQVEWHDQTASQDPKYKSCEPKNCGAGPSISYPFWLSPEQESFCGYPGFHLTCKQKRPALTISNDVYIINDIFYANNYLLVANAAVFEETCPTPLHNISLDRTPFNISSGYHNFSLLYNCTSKPKNYSSVYALSCATNSTHYSFAGFHLEEIQMNSYNPLKSCQDFVSVPIHTGEDITSLNRTDYTEVLKMGFRMSWTAHDCSACETSGGRCGFENREFLCFCRDRPRLISCDAGTSLNVGKKVGIGLGASLGTVVIMLVAFFFWYRRKKRQYESIFSRSIKSVPSSKAHKERRSSYNGVHLFSYEELEEATNNFDKTRELGEGGFGTVYYGKLLDGREVAVKRLYDNNYKMLEQFMNEVDILTRLRHQNLVLLYGCTSRHSRELLLVYQYIPNGTLADHLHGERAKPGSLPWSTRMNIAVETAYYATTKMIRAVADLSFQCLQRAKELRPSMEKVVEILKEIQSRDYNAAKTEDINSPSDGVGLLKSCPLPPSPDTVTVTWNSRSSTPYASV
ncbi:hypothetical protein SADUNF_Sadunf15G0038300 [Salix dunnii]|uniref:non-specific serine/threonine protein kinase n=1 Tax=Salix dunnii TaxID=1413687 RepID=A0A835MNK1_9ROSI|nr:hypothetical protein SADUNF_Sadunf15G0038300 [Salix dunnii]